MQLSNDKNSIPENTYICQMSNSQHNHICFTGVKLDWLGGKQNVVQLKVSMDNFPIRFCRRSSICCCADQSILVQKAPDEKLQWPYGTLDATSDRFGSKPRTQNLFWIRRTPLSKLTQRSKKVNCQLPIKANLALRGWKFLFFWPSFAPHTH